MLNTFKNVLKWLSSMVETLFFDINKKINSYCKKKTSSIKPRDNINYIPMERFTMENEEVL